MLSIAAVDEIIIQEIEEKSETTNAVDSVGPTSESSPIFSTIGCLSLMLNLITLEHFLEMLWRRELNDN